MHPDSSDFSKLTVLHTVVGLQLAHGGPSRSIPAMADAQSRLGADAHVIDMMFNSSAENGIPQLAQFHGVPKAKMLGWIFNNPALRSTIEYVVSGRKTTSVILHDHGIWMPQNKLVPNLAKSLEVPLVISPRGMLSAWSLNRRRSLKKLMWRFWQKRALESAAGFHATSSEEADDIRRVGLSQPIAVVPNSVRFPSELPARNSRCGRKRLLFLSRIHPVKGVKELLLAFKQASIADEWELSIVGPGEEVYSEEVKRLCSDLGLENSVTFEGSVTDEMKWQRYVDADVFILPSFSENFGLVIAEAMAAGLPVITTTGTPWQCIRDKRLGWWVAPNPKELAGAITEATSMSEAELHRLGSAASEYVRSQFSWDKSAQTLLEFYQSL